MKNFTELTETEQMNIDGGDFFGVVADVAQIVAGAATVVAGGAAMKAPVPGARYVGGAAIIGGAGAVASGVSNLFNRF